MVRPDGPASGGLEDPGVAGRIFSEPLFPASQNCRHDARIDRAALGGGRPLPVSISAQRTARIAGILLFMLAAVDEMDREDADTRLYPEIFGRHRVLRPMAAIWSVSTAQLLPSSFKYGISSSL